MLIDSHCHLYLDEFKPDLEDVIIRAGAAGINKFYLPAIDSSTTNAMLLLEQQYPGVCIPMIGLHPCSVKNDHSHEMVLIKNWLEKRKFAAIGEIGLDFYWDKTFAAEQYQVFNEQIELAILHELPIVIHTREAMAETISVVKAFNGRVKGVFHCFGGSMDEAKQIIELGFYLGIGGVVTYKKSGLSEVIKEIDLEHIVLETDAPFLTPVPFRGKRNESSYLRFICEKVAEVKKITIEEVEAITTANATKIFAC
ncbi:MAG: TatD family hydrolase [Ferruginibacter sp.]